MYTVGQRIRGTILNDQGEDVVVEGAFMFRTDDPEEHIQDIVIKTDAGETVYIDEQEAQPVDFIIDGEGIHFWVGERVYDCVNKEFGLIVGVNAERGLLNVIYDGDESTPFESTVNYFLHEKEGRERVAFAEYSFQRRADMA